MQCAPSIWRQHSGIGEGQRRRGGGGGDVAAAGRRRAAPLTRQHWHRRQAGGGPQLASGSQGQAEEPLPSSTNSGNSSSGDGGSGSAWVLPPPPPLQGKRPRSSWNAGALAYLGDSVWELYARRCYFAPPTKQSSYQAAVVGSVRAEAQAEMYARLCASGVLTEEEQDVLRWGRNATGTLPKRFSQSGGKTETYRAATALECLTGYLYLSDPPRLHHLMGILGLESGFSSGSSTGGSDDTG